MNERVTSAAELDALHMAVSIAAQAALVMDAGHRDWLVWEDDGGDLWATSYHTEDDETDIRSRILVDAERLHFPLTVLYRPDQPQRVQPSREKVVAALKGVWFNLSDEFLGRFADAVLALLAQQPTVAEVARKAWARGYSDAMGDYEHSDPLPPNPYGEGATNG